MTYIGLAQVAVFSALIVGLTKPLGSYMAHVFAGEPTLLRPVLSPLERLLYRIAGVDPSKEQGWLDYALVSGFQSLRDFGALRGAAAAASLACQSAEHGGRFSRSFFEHCHQFHYQYELAVVCRRDHAQLFLSVTLGPVAERFAMQAGLLF